MHSFIHRASRRRRRAHRHVLERARVPPRRFFQPRDDVRVSRHPVSSSFATRDADRDHSVSCMHSFASSPRPRGIEPGSTPSRPARAFPHARAHARAHARTHDRDVRVLCRLGDADDSRGERARARVRRETPGTISSRLDAIDDDDARG